MVPNPDGSPTAEETIAALEEATRKAVENQMLAQAAAAAEAARQNGTS